ncbi:DNA glycosylase AlkZ-like family protein [Nocardioides terrisoli]|uniref:DNA glycosylase AlkZ-like family protein n=1 Tax=Nocardioides terrisoli TaxID=3388267 RepID=UPI00287B7CF5|nr:crosslink repair DNA glycosylase YcaQ family protein [Nocardioides marmorisolisilvae]
MHHLSREQARRIALRAQLLDADAFADRPRDLLATVTHLTALPVEPTAAIAPSYDLVCWSRLGSSYQPSDLDDLLADRDVYDDGNGIRPMADLRLHLADMAAWPPWAEAQDWLEANELFRDEVLDILEADGPLPSKLVHATAQLPWRSSGWNADRNVRMMLELLLGQGVVAVNGREGNQKKYDLAERVYPEGVVAVPTDEAGPERDERRLRALGIARATGTRIPGEPIHVGGAGEPAMVEGTKGQWRVDPAQLERPFTGRTALLSPFDAVVRDRKRMEDLFDFDYVLEMYKPQAARRWGYFALPILYGDRLVGKLDATADRRVGRLFVDAVHQDVPFTRAMDRDVDAEIEALADWLGLTVTRQR